MNRRHFLGLIGFSAAVSTAAIVPKAAPKPVPGWPANAYEIFEYLPTFQGRRDGRTYHPGCVEIEGEFFRAVLQEMRPYAIARLVRIYCPWDVIFDQQILQAIEHRLYVDRIWLIGHSRTWPRVPDFGDIPTMVRVGQKVI